MNHQDYLQHVVVSPGHALSLCITHRDTAISCRTYANHLFNILYEFLRNDSQFEDIRAKLRSGKETLALAATAVDSGDFESARVAYSDATASYVHCCLGMYAVVVTRWGEGSEHWALIERLPDIEGLASRILPPLQEQVETLGDATAAYRHLMAQLGG